MKKKIVFGISVVTLVLGIIFVGCDNSNNCDNPNNSDDNLGGVYLTGSYGRYMVSQGTYNDRLIFTKETFSSNNRTGPFLSGTYKYDGAVLTLTISGVKHNKYANLSNSTLVISGDGAYSEFFNGTWTPR
jgi:hypothetical protein